MDMKSKKVWGYCRQSTPDDDGIEGQKRKIQKYVQTHGYELLGYTVVNGGNLKNDGPEMEGLRKAAEELQVDTLIVCSAGRISKEYDDMRETVETIGRFGMQLESIANDYFEIPESVHGIFKTMTGLMDAVNQEDKAADEDAYDYDEVGEEV